MALESLRTASPTIRSGIVAVCMAVTAASIGAMLAPSAVLAQETVFTPAGETLDQIRARLNNIGTGELKKILQENPDLVLIDVRTLRESAASGGKIRAKRSVGIPRGWLEHRIGDNASSFDTPIVVYCGTNTRSPLAANTLMKLGYTNVKNYADAFPAWKEAGLPVESVDDAPNSFLNSMPEEVVEGVWTSIGATAPSTYENSGHNNNLSFIITTDGVLVVNAGGSYLIARSLHEEIKKITDQPVKYVVLENGQGHAMLGSNYWKEQGATIIAHADAAHEIEESQSALLEDAVARIRDKAFATEVVLPDETFDTETKIVEMGGQRIELLNLGPAHSPGDIMVWLPQKNVIITGDMAFHERLLPVFEHTDTAGWLETWEKFAALEAKFVIPGHGHLTNMAEVTKYTKDYLAFMRREIGKLIEDGGDLQQAYKIDQSAFEHLDTYEFLARQNAGRIFRSMEFE